MDRKGDDAVNESKYASAKPQLRCKIYPANTFDDCKFVVVCSFYNGQYLLSRHNKRDTFETQGGHIESGESALDAARRELYEESGVTDAALFHVCDYHGYDDFGFAHGSVFLAVVNSIGELPESEMAEVKLFDRLPENLTYPNVTPHLFREAKKCLK